MNKESLTQTVRLAQAGSREALEQLMVYAYGLVDYQCKKLLPSAQSADKMTAIVLKAAIAKLDTLENPEDFFTWLGRLAAVRCMRVRATLLENGQGGESNEPVNYSFPGMELNKAETAKVAEMLTDMLPEDMRLNLYLYSLGGLPPKGIAGLTGVPEETVKEQIQSAQSAVLKQMKRYADQGVKFTQANSLPALLRTRMLLNPAPEKAQMVVYSLLPQPQRRAPAAPRQSQAPRQQPRQNQGSPSQGYRPPKKDESGLIRVLAVIAAILGLVLLISMGVLVSKLNKAKSKDTAWVPTAVTAQSLPSPARRGCRPQTAGVEGTPKL